MYSLRFLNTNELEISQFVCSKIITKSIVYTVSVKSIDPERYRKLLSFFISFPLTVCFTRTYKI